MIAHRHLWHDYSTLVDLMKAENIYSISTVKRDIYATIDSFIDLITAIEAALKIPRS